MIIGLHQKAPLVLLSDTNQLETVFGQLMLIDGSAGEHATYQKRYLFTDKACLATDNAQARGFLSKCAEKAGLDVVQYPPFCSDLNIAEDVLHYVKKQLQKSTFETVELLKMGIFGQWEKISIRHINKLVGSLPSKFLELIQRDGRPL